MEFPRSHPAKLSRFNPTKFPRNFTAGPTLPAKQYAVYQGSSESRHELLTTIYKPFRNLEKGSEEWLELWNSGRVWKDYYRPFDLELGRSWARENAFQLDQIDQHVARFPFTSEDFPDYLKIALTHQSVKIEGYRLLPGDSRVIYENLKEMTNSFSNAEFYDVPPKARDIFPPNDSHPGSYLEDVLMVRNNFLAQHFALSVMLEKDYIDEEDVKKLHGIILKDMVSDQVVNVKFTTRTGWALRHIVGDYRARNMQSEGCFNTIYPYPREVPANMKLLIEQCNTELSLHPLVYCIHFYAAFLHIHPFDDGNGRIARLLFAVLLIKRGYCPPEFQNFNRNEYIDALYHATSLRRPNAWFTMVCDAVEGMIQSPL